MQTIQCFLFFFFSFATCVSAAYINWDARNMQREDSWNTDNTRILFFFFFACCCYQIKMKWAKKSFFFFGLNELMLNVKKNINLSNNNNKALSFLSWKKKKKLIWSLFFTKKMNSNDSIAITIVDINSSAVVARKLKLTSSSFFPLFSFVFFCFFFISLLFLYDFCFLHCSVFFCFNIWIFFVLFISILQTLFKKKRK